MQRACDEAKKGWGKVSPNPLVGCVVLDSKLNFLSAGCHEYYGGPHAEVNAIKSLSKEQLHGAHVFVTLEPCAHYGKTPPCAKMLSELPIASVTYGQLDPNPLVSGKGIEILNNNHIKTFFLKSFENKCFQLAENFLYPMIHKKPFVALKVAMTQDECISYKDSQEQVWLSNPASLLHVHYLRANYDAILVGSQTILKDNPKLNIRHPDFVNKANQILILDPLGSLTENVDLNIYNFHKIENIYFITTEKFKMNYSRVPQKNILSCSLDKNGEFNLDEMLSLIYESNIKSIFVEGGAKTYRSFITYNKVNRFYIFKTPHRFFDKGLHWSQGAYSLNDLNLSYTEEVNLGDNLFLSGVCVR